MNEEAVSRDKRAPGRAGGRRSRDERRFDAELLAEVAGQAKGVLQRLLDRMGVEASAEASSEQQQVVLNIVGQDAETLVGKRGQVLDAIQLIVGKIVNRDLGEGVPLMVDAEGYRERRAESLVKLAERLREEALSSGRIVALNPMSPRDRRIIHMTLRDSPDVSTRSEGEGIDRRLLIVPERQ